MTPQQQASIAAGQEGTGCSAATHAGSTADGAALAGLCESQGAGCRVQGAGCRV